MPSAQINECSIHYQRAGEGPAVVFVHGGFADLASQLKLPAGGAWEWDWEWTFARHFDFVWYDRRGCYHSSRPPANDYSLEAQASDLEGLLDHLDIPTAHIMGSSAGGPISITFAATRPDRVRSLTLVGTACELLPPDEDATKIIKEQIAILERDGPEAAFDRRPEGVHTTLEVLWAIEEARTSGELQEYLESQETLKQQAGQFSRSFQAQWYAAELWNINAYMTANTCAAAQQVRAPTLILHGEKDRVLPPAWGETLADLIPSARFHAIEGGPHGLLFRSHEARQAALDFLKQIP